MTANQIAYARQREDVRHNQVIERVEKAKAKSSRMQAKASRQQAEVAAARQVEDARHNRETESINWWSSTNTLSESIRHNKEAEAINWFDTRSQDSYRQGSLAVQNRQASASEKQAQAALRQAGASYLQAQAALQQAQVAQQNADTRASELAESIRHNTETESLQGQSNYLKTREVGQKERYLELEEDFQNVRKWNAFSQGTSNFVGGFTKLLTGASSASGAGRLPVFK